MARKLQDRLTLLKNQSSKSKKSLVPSTFRRKVSGFGQQQQQRQQQLDDVSVNSSVSCRVVPETDDGENDVRRG